jgi:hypothetical protein
MGSYLGYFIKWLMDVATTVGEWFADLGYKITHDPVYGGVTVAIVVVLIVLFILKRRASGGK